MGEHDLSAGGDVMDRVRGCARDALAAYGGHPEASVELLNVSENATFLVSDPEAGPSVLRVHRLGYHAEQEIASELAWMDALRAEAGVRTPRVLPAADGRRVVTVPERARQRRSDTACASSSSRAPNQPARRTGRADQRPLRRAGRDHRADAPARQDLAPACLVHPVSLGLRRRRSAARPGWGRWQDGISVGPSERRILARLDDVLAPG